MSPGHDPRWSQPFTGTDVPRLRHALRREAEQRGVGGDALDDLVAALNELMINAVRHGGGRGVVSLSRDGDTLVCEVADDGPGFAEGPPSVFTPPPPGLAGGRGLWLAHRLTTGLTIHTNGGGVTASVTVRVTGPASP